MADEQHAFNASKRAADAPEVTARIKELASAKASQNGMPAFRACTCGATPGSCRCEMPPSPAPSAA